MNMDWTWYKLIWHIFRYKSLFADLSLDSNRLMIETFTYSMFLGPEDTIYLL